MASIRRHRRSWHLIAIAISLLIITSMVHLLFYQLRPSSFDFIAHFIPQLAKGSMSIFEVNRSLEISKMDMYFEDDEGKSHIKSRHGTKRNIGAPWKAEIERWLSTCGPNGSISSRVVVVETIRNMECVNDCSGHGVCNKELGECRCFHGYDGKDCSNKLEFECNLPATPSKPYGPWVFSICPGHCDKTRAFCFCGEGTSYPNRPLPETCAFRQMLVYEATGPRPVTNESDPDLENIFTTNSSQPGWCNVDPREAYTAKAQYKKDCYCPYDCFTGSFCEVPTQCTCINQCSRHGHCRGGSCQCDRGWYGIDCSVPSVSTTMQDWPLWLQPPRVDTSTEGHGKHGQQIAKVVVTKSRPLIYIYDLPAEFNSQLIEDRHVKEVCVNRYYDEKNQTLWSHDLYGSQMALFESLLASSHRTLNGEEADYFFVPVFDSCIFGRADDAPHFLMQAEHMNMRSFLALDFYKKVYGHIMEKYPYWNRSSGKDHIWFFAWDEGACYAPKEIWNSMMLVHWGNTNSKHNYSTTAYDPDNWDRIPTEIRGNHPCFDPDKDLVLPAWKAPDPVTIMNASWARTRDERDIFFYFNGNMGSGYTYGRLEDRYSMGLRQKLAREFASIPDKDGKLGRQNMKDVIVTAAKTPTYYDELTRSIFCGVLPGDGWSGRMEDSILHGCIPVIIQDGIHVPYENIFNYDNIVIRIREDDISSMITILRSINDTKIDTMLKNIKSLRSRFLYRDSIMLEAERQRKAFGKMRNWEVEISKYIEDDVFATFIEVLRYKLYNDPWRMKFQDQRKTHGFLLECMERSVIKVQERSATKVQNKD